MKRLKRGNSVPPLPGAETGGALFPQRSKNARISASPQRFSLNRKVEKALLRISPLLC